METRRTNYGVSEIITDNVVSFVNKFLDECDDNIRPYQIEQKDGVVHILHLTKLKGCPAYSSNVWIYPTLNDGIFVLQGVSKVETPVFGNDKAVFGQICTNDDRVFKVGTEDGWKITFEPDSDKIIKSLVNILREFILVSNKFEG